MNTFRLTRKPSRTWFLPLAAAMTILAGACGSSGDTAAAPELASLEEPADSSSAAADDEPEVAETSEAVDLDQAFAEFEACMADYGVSVLIGGQGGAPVEDFDPGSEPARDITPEDLGEAQAACDPILDGAFGSFDLSPEQEAEQADAFLEMEQCLAAAGFEIDMNGGAFQVPEDVDFDEFDVAMNDCAPVDIVGSGS